MKNFYLTLAACTALLCGTPAMAQEEAEQPTLTEEWSVVYSDWTNSDTWGGLTDINWNSTDAIKFKGDQPAPRTQTAVGLNGKLYSVNMATMSIHEFGPDGHKDVYKLPSLDGVTLNYTTANEELQLASCPDFYGILISRDDAGHFLVGHGFTTSAMPSRWTVYDPATGKAKHFTVEFEGMPKGSCQRIDMVGRAIGDVTKDGYLYIAPTSIFWATIKDLSWATADFQVAKILHFTGDGNVDNVECKGTVSMDLPLGNQTQSICQPYYSSIEELNDALALDPRAVEKGFILWSKQAGSCFADEYGQWSTCCGRPTDVSQNVDFLVGDKAVFAASEMAANYTGTNGFDSFVLQGKRYYVMNYSATKELYDVNKGTADIAVYDEEGKFVAEGPNFFYTSNLGYSAVSTQPKDDTSVSIYVYNSTSKEGISGLGCAAATEFTFKVPVATPGAVENVAVSENTTPEYFNLQGIRVANPENGIFVVRRGNKVTKEYVK